MTKRDTLQLKALIEQSFDIFNVYGKEPEAVKNIIQGFALVLAGHDLRDIQSAFKHWMENQSAMPTPADILYLTKDAAKRRADRANPSKGTFTQVIRRYPGKQGVDEILAEFPEGQHIGWIEMKKRWPEIRVHSAIRKDQ